MKRVVFSLCLIYGVTSSLLAVILKNSFEMKSLIKSKEYQKNIDEVYYIIIENLFKNKVIPSYEVNNEIQESSYEMHYKLTSLYQIYKIKFKDNNQLILILKTNLKNNKKYAIVQIQSHLRPKKTVSPRITPKGNLPDGNQMGRTKRELIMPPMGGSLYPERKLYPEGTSLYPEGKLYPDGKLYPEGTSLHPEGNSPYPERNSLHLAGNSPYLAGNSSYPAGNSSYPVGNSLFPEGNSLYPEGKLYPKSFQNQSTDLIKMGPPRTKRELLISDRASSPEGSSLASPPEGSSLASPEGTSLYPDGSSLPDLREKFSLSDPISFKNEPATTITSMTLTSVRRDFNGMDLPVSLFIRIPTMVNPIPRMLRGDSIYKILEKTGGYGGLDGMVLANLASYLNFTPVVKIPPAEYEYGYMVPNGTYVGSLGDVIYKDVVISFNGRFLNDYGTDRIEFTVPVSNDMFCIIVPSAERVPQWLKIFRCFSPWSWLCIFGAYWILTLFWYVLRGVNLVEFWKKRTPFAAFEIYTFFVSASVKLPSMDSHRVFFASCMFFNLIITGIFQGSLFRSYSTTTFYPNINTLQNFDNSGLRIGTASMSLAETFVADNTLGRNLKNKVVVNPGSNSMNRAAYKRDLAALERSADAKLRIQAEFTRPDGFELLHIVKECPRNFHVAYIVSKGSPFLSAFNNGITIFKESGLLNKWNADTTNALIKESRRGMKFESNKTKVFTLDDMQTAFYLLGIGLIFASTIFLVEFFVKLKK